MQYNERKVRVEKPYSAARADKYHLGCMLNPHRQGLSSRSDLSIQRCPNLLPNIPDSRHWENHVCCYLTSAVCQNIYSLCNAFQDYRSLQTPGSVTRRLMKSCSKWNDPLKCTTASLVLPESVAKQTVKQIGFVRISSGFVVSSIAVDAWFLGEIGK